MRKLFSFLAAILFAGSMMAADETLLTYSISAANVSGEQTAGNGKITFGKATQETDNGSGIYCVALDKGTGKYIGLTLEEGKKFQVGDSISFNANTTAGTPSATKQMGLVLCSAKETSGDTYTDIAGGYANLSKKTDREDISYVITTGSSLIGLSTIYVYRQSTGTVNVYSVTITRPAPAKDTLSQEYYGFQIGETTPQNPADYTWNDGTVTMNDSYTSATAPENYKWKNHITYTDQSIEDKLVDVEFTMNGNYWEATKEFDDQTVTIKVPVDKTVNVYVHFVESWNGTTGIWSAIGGSWASINDATETIGGCTWYKTTYNNTEAKTFQVSNGNGANSVEQTIAATVTGNVYYVAYNKWEDSKFVLRKVEDPARKTATIYFQKPAWDNLSDFKMWVEDGVAGANVYGTQADYVFTQTATFAGQEWNTATIHYFGEKCDIYPKFKQGETQWESAAKVEGNTENIYISYASWKADEETRKTFTAASSTSIILKAGEASELEDVTEAITWDWSKVGTKEMKALSERTKNQFVTYTDFVGATSTNFAKAQIAFKGEYAVRNTTMCQNGTIKFHTTVPGTITVKFSDTGVNGDNPIKRYLNVNGVNTTFYAQRNGATNGETTSEEITVPAGDVVICGMQEDGETTAAICVYTLTFTPILNKDKATGAYTWNHMTTDNTKSMYKSNGNLITKTAFGKHGTICLPYNATVTGAVIYAETANRVEGGLEFDYANGDAEHSNQVEAGHAYIYFATDNEQIWELNDSDPAVDVDENDLLVGTYSQITLANNEYFFYTDDECFHPAGANVVLPAFRACIPNMPGVSGNAPIRLIMPKTGVATGVENAADYKATKAMVDGKIVILRGAKSYNVAGQVL